MSYEKVLNLVIAVVKEIGEDQDNDALSEVDEDTRLFGENLDSMGIVFLVSDMEDRIADEMEINLTLADERAMSQKTSPFRSVKTLARYITMLIEEQNNN